MELQPNHGAEQMDRRKDTAVEAILEQLIETGPGDLAGVFARAFDPAMQIERFLGAGHYGRTPERRGYANGTKPKTAGHEGEPFCPQSLERGRRPVAPLQCRAGRDRRQMGRRHEDLHQVDCQDA